MARPPTHGMTGTGAHASWVGMRERCSNPNHSRANSYIGKGIKVCKRWDKFENFYADMGDRPEGHSLERIDRDRDYTPENCVWATPKEQAINRDTTHFLTANGQTLHLTEWARKLDIQPSAIRWRLENGWPVEKAVTATPRKDSRRFLRKQPIGSW